MNRVIQKLRRAPHWLRNKLAPGAVILCYHRIADDPLDPYEVSITPHHFAEHLAAIRECGHPIRLQDFVAMLRDGKPPRRAVVVTFDDGYADNLYAAKPLLERYDVPATVFVATDRIARKRGFWWDQLERLLLRTETLPAKLNLCIGGKDYNWELGAARHYSEHDQLSNRSWNLNAPTSHDFHPRLSFFRELYFTVRSAGYDERTAIMDQLSAWAGGEPDAQSAPRMMSDNEIRDLAANGLIEVGAHTVTHPMLSALPDSDQQREVEQSKSELESVLDAPIVSFAYPHGDYNVNTISAVRTAGYDCACTTVSQIVRQDGDLFALPRIGINNQQVMSGEWNGERLGKLLRWLALG